MRLFLYLAHRRRYGIDESWCGVVLGKDEQNAKRNVRNNNDLDYFSTFKDITLDIVSIIPQLPKVNYE